MCQLHIENWRKRVGVEPTQDRLRPLPGLKSGRPTGSDSLPCQRTRVILSVVGSGLQSHPSLTGRPTNFKDAILHRDSRTSLGSGAFTDNW